MKSSRSIYDTPLQTRFFEMYKDLYITDDMICDMFSRKRNREPLFYVTDIIKINNTHSRFVSNDSLTTIGSLIFNKTCIDHIDIFGYINEPLNGSVINKIDDNMAVALMEKDITTDQYAKYIDRCQYLLGGTMASIINSSMSEEILQLPPKAKRRKKELMEKYHDQLFPVVDPMVSAKIEREVCDIAQDEIRKSNPEAMDIFDAKCGVDFYNNYKTMFVMKGPIQDNTNESTNGYKIVTSNYDDGVSMEDYPKFADSLITSAYSKGKEVGKAGYDTKKFNMLFQNVVLDKKGSDCGTKLTIQRVINDTSTYLYRYIMEKNKPVLLTPENIGNYIGKTVSMRSPMYCHSEKYCNICYGDRKYILGITNVGLSFNTMTNSKLNASMKKFHDITIKVHEIDIKYDLPQIP